MDYAAFCLHRIKLQLLLRDEEQKAAKYDDKRACIPREKRRMIARVTAMFKTTIETQICTERKLWIDAFRRLDEGLPNHLERDPAYYQAVTSTPDRFRRAVLAAILRADQRLGDKSSIRTKWWNNDECKVAFLFYLDILWGFHRRRFLWNYINLNIQSGCRQCRDSNSTTERYRLYCCCLPINPIYKSNDGRLVADSVQVCFDDQAAPNMLKKGCTFAEFMEYLNRQAGEETD